MICLNICVAFPALLVPSLLAMFFAIMFEVVGILYGKLKSALSLAPLFTKTGLIYV